MVLTVSVTATTFGEIPGGFGDDKIHSRDYIADRPHKAGHFKVSPPKHKNHTELDLLQTDDYDMFDPLLNAALEDDSKFDHTAERYSFVEATCDLVSPLPIVITITRLCLT